MVGRNPFPSRKHASRRGAVQLVHGTGKRAAQFGDPILQNVRKANQQWQTQAILASTVDDGTQGYPLITRFDLRGLEDGYRVTSEVASSGTTHLTFSR